MRRYCGSISQVTRNNEHSRHLIRRLIRHGASFLILALLVEYVILPELSGAKKSLSLLSKVNVGLLFAGIGFEVAALISYAFLTKSVLKDKHLSTSALLRINISTLAVSHVLPGGSAPGTALGYRLMTSRQISPADATFALATQGVGSAIILNLLLWFALIISIPFHSLNNPLYVIAAIVGSLLMGLIAVLIVLVFRGKNYLNNAALKLSKVIPFVKKERIVKLIDDATERIHTFVSDKKLVVRASIWALCNWLFDAGSLWIFIVAFGKVMSPIDLLVAYGLANVLAVIPITPGGLGVIEGILIPTIIGFGTPGDIATLGVLSYRLFNFWLPIPAGLATYISLRVGPGAPWSQKNLEREPI
jgi:uncharacterized protein (TIRG00374 family)